MRAGIDRRALLAGGAALAASGAVAQMPLARGLLLPKAGAPYLGQVATKCAIPITNTTSVTRINSRSPHFARDPIASLQIVLANWIWRQVNKTEQGSGATATYTAAIEYPAGRFTQVTFGGAATGTAASDVELVSDPVTVTIPAGALFWVRVFYSASNLVFGGTPAGGSNLLDIGNGAAFEASSSLTDKTMGGTIAASGNNYYSPVAIIAMTRRPSVLLVGDSRTWGANDAHDASGDVGELARSIGPSLAYINLGSFGDRATVNTAGNYARRGGLARYCSHVLCEFGINDITSGRTAAQLWGDLTTIFALYFTGKPIFQTTIPPVTTSTDTWATLAGQTPETHFAARTAFNAIVRGCPAPLTGFFDTADAVESARDSGLWKVTGVAGGYTNDGTHESQLGHLAIRGGGAIRVKDFRF